MIEGDGFHTRLIKKPLDPRIKWRVERDPAGIDEQRYFPNGDGADKD